MTATAPVSAVDAPGSVTGRILRLDGKPAINVVVYAGRVSTESDLSYALIDALNDRHVDTGDAGQFAFKDLPAGQYVIGLLSPVGVILPHDAANKPILFSVTADKPTHLGDLKVGYDFPDG